jgi:hypothetical protein
MKSNGDITGLATGTLVTTPDGKKKIEEVKAGDLVLSGVGEDKTDFFKISKVSSKLYNGLILRITANHNDNTKHQFCATPNHVCFGNSFKKLSQVAQDSILLYSFNYYDDEAGCISHSVTKRGSGDSQGFDNIDCAEDAAFQMAHQNGDAEIKHFACFTYHPTFEFMHAADLEVTMQIPSVKKNSVHEATITSIEEEQYDGLVYNLDIPEARNFAANGVLVHDSTYIEL